MPNMGTKRISTSHSSLVDALFTSTQKKVLGLLFSNPDKKYFATEIIRLADSGSGAVQRELSALSETGLVQVEFQGRQKFYQANRHSPIYQELRSIILKTVGLTEPMKKALKSVQNKIDIALLYGSIPRGTDTATSDIDLLVVSKDLSLVDLYPKLSEVESVLGRKINPTLYTPAEFQKRIQNKNSFIENVLSHEYIMLIGEKDDLKAT